MENITPQKKGKTTGCFTALDNEKKNWITFEQQKV